MTAYLSQRLAGAAVVLFVVASLTFSLVRVLPGDLAEVRLGESASPESVRELRQTMGLDEALPSQYVHWVGNIATGDFGESLTNGRPVTGQFGHALPITLELTLFSISLALLLGVPLGVISAYRRGSVVDYAARIIAALGQAIPTFWSAILSLTLLSIYFQWTPPFAYQSLWENPAANLQQLALPAIILAWGMASIVVRIVRSSMLDTLQNDFIRSARAKGLSEPTVLRRHALRHALMPLITIVGVQIGTLLGGTLIVEQIFVLPGVGKLTLYALVQRDYTQLEFNVLVLATLVVSLNLLVDLSYVLIDPRIRASGVEGTR